MYEFIDAQARRCNEAVDDIFRATAFLPVSLLRQLTPMVPTEEAEELERLGVLSGSVLEELKVCVLFLFLLFVFSCDKIIGSNFGINAFDFVGTFA